MKDRLRQRHHGAQISQADRADSKVHAAEAPVFDHTSPPPYPPRPSALFGIILVVLAITAIVVILFLTQVVLPLCGRD
jgi:hypothetical protein